MVAVGKHGPITISDKRKCLRFYDERSAMLFMHFMISNYGVIATDYIIGMEHSLRDPDKPERSLVGINNDNPSVENRFKK